MDNTDFCTVDENMAKPDNWARAIAVIAIVATVTSNLFMWYGYYQPTIRLLEEQAAKKPVLVINVYPSTNLRL